MAHPKHKGRTPSWPIYLALILSLISCGALKLGNRLPDEVLRHEIKPNYIDECVISGYIKDEHNEPLLFSDAIIENAEGKVLAGAITNIDGYYEIRISQDYYADSLTIAFKFIGYNDFRMPIEAKDQHYLDIRLTPNAIILYD